MNIMNISVSELFDLSHSLAAPLLNGVNHPWQALDMLSEYICKIGAHLGKEYVEIFPEVWVSKSADVAKTAEFCGPCIIGYGTQVRHGAFIRGGVLVGCNAVVGNSTEVKNSIIFDNVQIPHYNYVGDSILGYRAHMGAGAVTSNVKGDKTVVCVKNGDELIETGRRKLGAIVGDFAEIGCNSVLNPGTIIGKNTQIYPLSSVRGTVLPNSIYKKEGVIVAKNSQPLNGGTEQI